MKSYRVKLNMVFVLKKKKNKPKRTDAMLFYEEIQSGIIGVQV